MTSEPTDQDRQTFRFFTFDITPQVFYHTSLSFAFVNIRPILPGHVLVSPIRPVVRLSELTDAEVADLFVTVKRVGNMLSRVYEAPALTIPLQDGVEAGQTVPHLHVHVIPRPKLPPPGTTGTEGNKEAGTGGNGEKLKGLDEIYEKLEGQEGDVGAFLALREFREARRGGRAAAGGGLPDLESIPLRSPVDMLKEAGVLRGEMEKEMEGVARL